ncbi:chorismate synthase [Oxobacter pfennigii]|uniref:Chorismate synthase n=1 Tax=Oxobacter pfennigii TaxID=36849 RepID=A0A0P8YRN5_9CLOT|nr:chorismate synthase [Oxobacter pfennigii]KPU42259.1 chorismate synthase [Oxobacter pfennigii]
MRYLDAGESHGEMFVAVVEGMPSNLIIDEDLINYELEKRQGGYGRGGRMKIEKDKINIVTGVRQGKTTGAPITLIIRNKDYENWKEKLNDPLNEKIQRPRPGHADLNGIIKYDLDDIRDIIERSSARQTSIRTSVGALATVFLKNFNIKVHSRVVQIGSAIDNSPVTEEGIKIAEASDLMCSSKECEEKMIEEITLAQEKGDTLGGKIEIIIKNVPAGLGSHVQWDKKLDARLAGAMMSIQGIKAVEIGMGSEVANLHGSKVHDEIYYSKDKGYYRGTNNAGGIEGGMSNGEDIIIRVSMKPIPTLRVPLSSVDISTKEACKAVFERSDVCAVPAAGVVARNAAMWEIACAVMEKFGGDSMKETTNNFNSYKEQVLKK